MTDKPTLLELIEEIVRDAKIGAWESGEAEAVTTFGFLLRALRSRAAEKEEG